MSETISGTIDHLVFHNPESGFAVLRVQIPGRRDLVSVVGLLAAVVAGEFIEASGSWVHDRDHGLQFKAEHLRATPPCSAAGIEKYLASGLIKGIGRHYAAKIVEAFGERTLTVIDESPSFLKEVKGIGPRRLQQIRTSWHEQKAVRSIMVFLQVNGIGTARALRIYKTYGERAVDLVRENPYRLATDVWGFGFKSADQLALRLGVAPTSPLRARAAVRFVLQELSSEGHVGFPATGVIEETVKRTAIEEGTVREAIEYLRTEGELVRDSADEGAETWLYSKPLFMAELGVARVLAQLCTGEHPLGSIKLEAAVQWVEAKMKLELAPTQRDAIRQAISKKVLVITGGPGVGKTTLVRGILEIFAAKGMRCLLCAPTGRAAKRLEQTTGQGARTIHRTLEFDPTQGGFKRDRHLPLDADLVVVDEVSMVDIVLMNQLLRAIPETASVVLVGDVDQLPSVGPGNVLSDIIRSGLVPVVRLTEIFRQADRSWIVQAAHRVNQGEMPESAPAGQGDFYFVEVDAPVLILDRIITMVRDRIPSRFGLDSLRDIQVLTPMNRLELGARRLNERLQEALNPPTSGPELLRDGWRFLVGDKVLQKVNNYQKEVFNGDIGRIVGIDLEEQEVAVEFEGRRVDYDFGEMDELSLAYAMTIHKSQGSEYPAVVIPVHTQHFMLLQRNLLYTGITRGKRLAVLVGSRKALATAIGRQDTQRRCSALGRRLQEAGDAPSVE